jgi:predicted transcriptional regulator
MEFHDWLERKFIEWRGDTRKNVTQFASYLGVSQPTVSAWINNTRGQPTTPKIINSLASKLGPEIYDILGMTRPAGSELSPKKRHLLELLEKNDNDQLTDQVIAELEAALNKKYQK